jgi:tetratricopeptide (TPR) repeat protein
MEISLNLPPAESAMLGIQPKGPVDNPYYRATQLDQAGKFEEAEKIYHELLSNNFYDTVVLASLGMNLAMQGRQGEANVLLTRALQDFERTFPQDLVAHGIKVEKQNNVGGDDFATIKRAELMNAIGTTWKNENKTEQARYWFNRAQTSLKETNPDIQNNLATLYINEGKPEQAFTHLNAALKVAPTHAQALWNRSLANLEVGNYEAGFAEYQHGKRAQVRMDRNYSSNAQTPEWDGTPGKVVVVYGEQGIGDEIMFASLLPEMIRDCKQVIFDCHKKLHRLFTNSFPEIDIYGTREDPNITWAIDPATGLPSYPIEAKIAIGDLPRIYRKKLEDFPGTPYIEPTKEANMRWGKRLADLFNDRKPVIGINWIGGHKKTRVEVRSLSLEKLLPILKQDAHFVSLQYTPCEQEIYDFEAKHGIKIHHWPEASYNDHYDETAGLVANCDLVITCCSSVVHLAGSMGVRTWVLTPSRPAWRYRLDLDYMPWYGSTVHLIRQEPGTIDWEPVVTKASERLAGFIEDNSK